MEHSQDLQQVHWFQFIYMDRLITTHQCNCMTWLGECSKRHLVYLKKRQQQTRRYKRCYCWSISLLASKKYNRGTLNTRLFILQIQLQRKPFACAYILIKPVACAYILIKPFAYAYILIKPFMHRHHTTPPLQGSDRRNYAATHWLQSFTKKHIISLQYGPHSRKKSMQYMETNKHTHKR